MNTRCTLVSLEECILLQSIQCVCYISRMIHYRFQDSLLIVVEVTRCKNFHSKRCFRCMLSIRCFLHCNHHNTHSLTAVLKQRRNLLYSSSSYILYCICCTICKYPVHHLLQAIISLKSETMREFFYHTLLHTNHNLPFQLHHCSHTYRRCRRSQDICYLYHYHILYSQLPILHYQST